MCGYDDRKSSSENGGEGFSEYTFEMSEDDIGGLQKIWSWKENDGKTFENTGTIDVDKRSLFHIMLISEKRLQI